MIELRTYFLETYYRHEYYMHKFQELINYSGIDDEFWISDDQEAIDRFRELIEPYNPNNPMKDISDNNEFIYICNYLNDKGYYIEEFPQFLERPTDRWTLSYDKIRKKIIERDGYDGCVRWAARSAFVENLKILKKEKYQMSYELDEIFKKVSTRSADFNKMISNEKLEAICNCIEYLLKPNKKSDKFIVLNYDDSCDYLSDEIVKGFRNKLECFRHSTEEDLKKRDEFTDNQKEFLINYGLLIMDFISKKLGKI